ncbi:hypothetical protein E4U36_002733 [Claviceps purpurea]|nr:hypothetical protein E4U36_002733 [Claviceps purpurea]
MARHLISATDSGGTKDETITTYVVEAQYAIEFATSGIATGSDELRGVSHEQPAPLRS